MSEIPGTQTARQNKHTNRLTFHQSGALITLLIVTIWSMAALWFHMTTPSGMDDTELSFLGILSILFLIHLPLYWVRVRWSYLSGTLALLGMFVGAAIAILDQNLILSWSFYILSVGLAYIAALTCIYFSLMAFRDHSPPAIRTTLLGVGGFILVSALIGIVVTANLEAIQRQRIDWTMNTITNELGTRETLDEQLQFLVEHGNVPATSVGIVVNDTLVWSKDFGNATPETIYEIGSVTKPFVATAVCQLHDRGLIDLDADVNTYLPFAMRHPEYADKPITIRMLLTHQSGLGHLSAQYDAYHLGKDTLEWLTNNRGFAFPTLDPRPAFADFMASYLTPGGTYHTSGTWYAMEPGTRYGYSTPGYDALVHIVEQVTKQPFSEYLQENVLTPLDMRSTGLVSQDLPGTVAVPHERTAGVLSLTNVALPISDYRVVGGGGLYSNVADLAQFMIAHLNGGLANGAQILEPETVEMMHQQAVSARGKGDLSQVGYGLGFSQMNTAPWEYWGHFYDMQGAIGHGGSTWGTVAQLWFVEKEAGGYGIIRLTNVDRDFEPDDMLWFFAIDYKIQVKLLAEARARYEAAMIA